MKTSISELSPRQQEIVRLVAKGLVDKQIAEELGISQRTVRGHLQIIFQRSGVQTRSKLTYHFFDLVEK